MPCCIIALFDYPKISIHKRASMADTRKRKGDVNIKAFDGSPGKVAQDKTIFVLTHAIICMEIDCSRSGHQRSGLALRSLHLDHGLLFY